MLRVTESGLYCDAGDFYIDPWRPVARAIVTARRSARRERGRRPVARAIVTHAHSDHLTWGCGHYLVAERGVGVSRERLGQWQDRVEGVAFGETRSINGVRVSLHPAGHILGSRCTIIQPTIHQAMRWPAMYIRSCSYAVVDDRESRSPVSHSANTADCCPRSVSSPAARSSINATSLGPLSSPMTA